MDRKVSIGRRGVVTHCRGFRSCAVGGCLDGMDRPIYSRIDRCRGVSRHSRASARPCVCFRSERKRRATGYYIGARQRVFWCGRVNTVFVFDAGTGMESREGTHGTD
jgi:hypothetical protein